MSDLAALFPDLPADILRDFETPANGYDGGLTADGQRPDVTDEQVEAYLQSIGSLRAPLKPLVKGQQAPPAPEFYRNGRTAPAANNAVVEPPDYGDGTLPPPPDPEPVPPLSQPPLTTPSAPPPPPATERPNTAPPVHDTPPPSTGFPDAGDIPPSPPTPAAPIPSAPGAPGAVSNEAALAAILQSDPQLRQVIADYYQGRFTPPQPQPFAGPPVAPSPPQAAPQYYPPPQQYAPAPPSAPTFAPPVQAGQPTQPPQFQFDEYTDPNIRALVEHNARIQAQLDSITTSQRYAAEREQQVQMRHFTQVVEGAVSQWGQQYSLPPNVLADVRQVAARMGAAQTYMNGIHPITGLPVTPDPTEATKAALDIAYYSTPSARELETQRTLARAQVDAARRQKLGGVGGSSASVPRQQPAPTDAAGRRAAMNQEVAEMMRGEWTGASTN